jgi:photosystem II stability/assembly factor-like uncharacterized protein
MRPRRRLSTISLLATTGLLLTLPCSAVGGASGFSAQHISGTVHSRALIAPLNSLMCMSAKSCVAVGARVTTNHGGSLSNSGQPDGGFAATTSDGGAQWASTPRLVGVKSLDAMACTTARTCIAVGGNPVSKKYIINKGAVTRTRDGGHTWRVLATLPKKVGELTSISCPVPHFCMAVGSSEAINAQAVALVTRSAGQHWTRLRLPHVSLTHVTCTARLHCVAEGFSDGLSIIVTSDGGTTWTTAQLPTGNYPGGVIGVPIFGGLACPSRTRCLLVGGIESQRGVFSGLIMASVDGGESWSYTPLPTGVALMNAISCPTAMRCVAVGSDFSPAGLSFILTTTDGGQHWVGRRAPNVVTDLESVSCLSTKTCIATGFKLTTSAPVNGRPATVATSDGGMTWKAMQ